MSEGIRSSALAWNLNLDIPIYNVGTYVFQGYRIDSATCCCCIKLHCEFREAYTDRRSIETTFDLRATACLHFESFAARARRGRSNTCDYYRTGRSDIRKPAFCNQTTMYIPFSRWLTLKKSLEKTTNRLYTVNRIILHRPTTVWKGGCHFGLGIVRSIRFWDGRSIVNT
jgi:hypothetical protein